MVAAHLVTLLCVGAAGLLGLWQYDAWRDQRTAVAADLSRLDPVPLDAVMGPDDPFLSPSVGRPVILDGTWLPESTVYISGRARGDTEGFWVVTPLTTGDESDPALPVVRGWVAAPEAAPAPPTGRGELVVVLQPPEGTNEVDDDPTDDVLPQVRIADLIQRVDQDIYGAYAVVPDEVSPGSWPHGEAATNDGTAGLEPASIEQLPPAGRFTALGNLLYALEWWVFGAFAAFMWWRYVREVMAVDGHAEAAVPETDPTADPVPSEP